MRISLVIPAYNEETYLGGCLDSVLASGGRFHEIIVIDNASTDGTAAVAAARRGVRVVHEAKKGLLAARQRGYQEATGEAVGYIDADTRMPKGWWELANDTLSSRPQVVALSGPARYWDAKPWQRVFLGFLWRV